MGITLKYGSIMKRKCNKYLPFTYICYATSCGYNTTQHHICRKLKRKGWFDSIIQSCHFRSCLFCRRLLLNYLWNGLSFLDNSGTDAVRSAVTTSHDSINQFVYLRPSISSITQCYSRCFGVLFPNIWKQSTWLWLQHVSSTRQHIINVINLMLNIRYFKLLDDVDTKSNIQQ